MSWENVDAVRSLSRVGITVISKLGWDRLTPTSSFGPPASTREPTRLPGACGPTADSAPPSASLGSRCRSRSIEYVTRDEVLVLGTFEGHARDGMTVEREVAWIFSVRRRVGHPRRGLRRLERGPRSRRAWREAMSRENVEAARELIQFQSPGPCCNDGDVRSRDRVDAHRSRGSGTRRLLRPRRGLVGRVCLDVGDLEGDSGSRSTTLVISVTRSRGWDAPNSRAAPATWSSTRSSRSASR